MDSCAVQPNGCVPDSGDFDGRDSSDAQFEAMLFFITRLCVEVSDAGGGLDAKHSLVRFRLFPMPIYKRVT
jgi:hypothetical protein